MRRLGYVAAVFAGAFVLNSCTDQMQQHLTAPTGPRLSFTEMDETSKLALENAIRAGIRCLLVDTKQESQKLSDFDAIVVKANKGEVQSVTDYVNNFVKWANDLGTKKTTQQPTAGDCQGRTLSYAQAAQELYNLMYLYSGQYAKITSVNYGSGIDAAIVVCFPNADCELDGDNAFIRAPAGTFNFPVIVGFTPFTGALPAAFNDVGDPVPPPYEFFTIPEGVVANNLGWGRYICVSDEEFGDNGEGLNLYRYTGGQLELVPEDTEQILCDPPASELTFSNPLLRRVYAFATSLTAPLRPTRLYATGHRAIGGPATTASPHSVVRESSVVIEPAQGCEVRSAWADANSQSWDFQANPYPRLTSFASLTVRLSTNTNVTARARRFTSSNTGEKDLGLASGVSSQPAPNEEEGYDVTFSWPSQPVQPGGRVDIDISSTAAVSYGVSATTGCVLKEIGGQTRSVVGTVSGHPQGGDDQIN